MEVNGSKTLSALKNHSRNQSELTHRNIEAINSLAKESLARRTRAECVGDYIADTAGRLWFINLHVIWFGVWILFNNLAPPPLVFDPYPFQLLTMVVSLEAIFLTLFVLMSQNRSTLQADQRNQLDLQINLLSEHENTKMLQMLKALCAHHGLSVGNDPEVAELATRTDPRELVDDIKRTSS